MSLYNIYSPNNDNKSLFHTLGSKLEADLFCITAVGEDLNSIHIPIEYRRGSGRPLPPKQIRARDKVIPFLLSYAGLRDSC